MLIKGVKLCALVVTPVAIAVSLYLKLQDNILQAVGEAFQPPIQQRTAQNQGELRSAIGQSRY